MQALRAPPLKHTCREQNRVANLQAKKGICSEVFGRSHIFLVTFIYAMKDIETEILEIIFPRNVVVYS